MDDVITIVVLSAFGATAVARWSMRYLERRRARAELRKRPPLQPSTEEGTVVTISGVVRAIETLTSPLAGTPCVVHHSRVELHPNLPRRVLGMVAPGVHETVGVTPFIVEREGEDDVLVEGTGVVLDLPSTLRGDPDRLNAQQFLALNGVHDRDTKPRYDEIVVEPGQRISVAGLLMMDPAAEPVADERGFREPSKPRLRLTGNAKHPLAIGKPTD